MRKLRVLGTALVCLHGLLWPLASSANDVYVLQTGYVLPDGVRQLVPGVDQNNGGRFVASTIGLVEAIDAAGNPIVDGAGNPIIIAIDPGFGGINASSLKNALKGVRSNLTDADITHVFISHHHPDHTLYAGLFPNATLVDFWATYKGDLWEDHPDNYEIAPGIEVLRTPGHTLEDASLVVDTAAGTVVFTHVWWCWGDGSTCPFTTGAPAPEVDPIAADPSLDQSLLKASRTSIDALSPVCIIPGHGAPYDPASGGPCSMVTVLP